MPNVDENTDDTGWTYSGRTPVTFAHTLRTTVSYPYDRSVFPAFHLIVLHFFRVTDNVNKLFVRVPDAHEKNKTDEIENVLRREETESRTIYGIPVEKRAQPRIDTVIA